MQLVLFRKTSAKVDVIFNREPELVTALNEELQLAIVDGVKMNYFLNTVKIEQDGILVEPVIKGVDEEGNVTYINDSDNAYKFECSSVIIAIGQGAESNIVNNSKKNIDTTNRGLIQTTQKGVTTRPGVFAAGDVVSGARTVVEAVAATKLVAEEIEEYIRNNY